MIQQHYIKIANHPRLYLRKNRFYIRVSIPRKLQYLADKKEIKYVLNANSYYDALVKLREESYRIDLLISIWDELDMKIKNNQIEFDKEDIKQIVKLRIREILDFIEEKNFKIQQGKIDYKEHLLLSKKIVIDAEKGILDLEIPLKYIEKWLKKLNNSPSTHPSIRKIAEYALTHKIETDYPNPNFPYKHKRWIYKLTNLLASCDSYLKAYILEHSSQNNIEKSMSSLMNMIKNQSNNIQDIEDKIKKLIKKQEKSDTNRHIGDIASLVEAVKQERTQELNSQIIGKTTWKELFKEFENHKKINKQTNENTIQQNYACLETIFILLKQKHIEKITYKDCQNLSLMIHKLPKKWKDKYSTTKLLQIVNSDDTPKDVISNTTMNKYLRAFKEFMAYARKKRLTTESFGDDIDIPKIKQKATRFGFSEDDLLKIFSKNTYPHKYHIKYSYRYWIPIISLFSGMRLNEICQLYKEDIKQTKKGTYYIHICDDRKDQHLKTSASKRNVPIHPKLIELGFIKLVKETKKNNRIFYQLKYNKDNYYTDAMSAWFNRYLTELKIKPQDTAIKKDFHSFRHTTKPYLRDNGVSAEYCNAICGWEEGSGMGEKVYGGKIDVDILFNEICKLQYPFLETTLNQLI